MIFATFDSGFFSGTTSFHKSLSIPSETVALLLGVSDKVMSNVEYMIDHATSFTIVITRSWGIRYFGFLMAQPKPSYKISCLWDVHIEVP
ncbi:hypothetical protein AYI68_g364 [Smittium mucronatum]|uniref:Uncharacterized protein n=1 Tax=Smittium mucronatum TaxID=133383 RepID=A0A1R0H8K0_9FUNG|nr:hypothetical protein AYI68_g364 [Smittium mucronatum]